MELPVSFLLVRCPGGIVRPCEPLRYAWTATLSVKICSRACKSRTFTRTRAFCPLSRVVRGSMRRC